MWDDAISLRICPQYNGEILLDWTDLKKWAHLKIYTPIIFCSHSFAQTASSHCAIAVSKRATSGYLQAMATLMRTQVLQAFMYSALLHTASIPPRVDAEKLAPHIFFVLVDDLGSADVGFTRNNGFNPANQTEVQTPTLDKLAAEGVLLMRHYVHYTCTPTRSAVQTGRLPVHVQLSLKNPDEPSSGIPRNMRWQ